MKNADINKIKKTLKKSLDEKRYIHSQGVAYTAVALAMKYSESLKKAELAGLLHDCAKCLGDDEKISICKKYNICISESEKKNPFLLHAKVGGFLAMHTYHIQDEDIINAILNHTTGRPKMSLLEKIIFVADYIEPERKDAPNLTFIRKIAFENLDNALVMILKDTLEYLQHKKYDIDPMTEKTYLYYKNVLEKESEV